MTQQEQLDKTPKTDGFTTLRGYDGLLQFCRSMERDLNHAEHARKANSSLYERALRERNALLEALKALLIVFECADEQGYVEGLGFVDIDTAIESARDAIKQAEEAP